MFMLMKISFSAENINTLYQHLVDKADKHFDNDENINTLYQLAHFDNDEYTTFRQGWQAPVEFDEIIEYLCYPEAVWKLNPYGQVMSFQARFLKQAAAAVFLFIIARLMPAKHRQIWPKTEPFFYIAFWRVIQWTSEK